MDEFTSGINIGEQLAEAVVIIKGATFSGNTAANGAAFLVSGGTVTVAVNGTADNAEIAASDGSSQIIPFVPGGKIPITGATTSEAIPVALQPTISEVAIADGIFFGNTASNSGGAVCNAGTFSMRSTTFSGNTAAQGGAIDNAGTMGISGSTFTANFAEAGGAVCNDGKFSMQHTTFSGNTASMGGAIDNAGTATISGSTFTANFAEAGGAIYTTGGTLEVLDAFFSGNTAAQGGAIYAQDGSLKIAGGTFRHASDTVRCIGKSGLLMLGGTVTTAAQIYAENAISFDDNTRLNIVISGSTGGNEAFLGNYDTAFANDANFSLTVTLSAAQAAGKYLLADSAAKFNKEVAICVDGTEAGTISLGTALTVDGRQYLLANDDENNVALWVGGEIIDNTGVVTVNGDTDTIVIGGVVYTGTPYSQDEIDTALAEKETVAAHGVSYEYSHLSIAYNQTFVADAISMSKVTTTGDGGAVCNYGTATISGSTFSGNTAGTYGGAVYNNGGALTIRNSVFATESDTIYSQSENLTIGGTITTAAQIFSDNAITVEADTSLVLDLTSYTEGNTVSILGNYDTAFAKAEDNFTLSVKVTADQAAGNYILADSASQFGETVTVVCDGVTVGTLAVGGGTTTIGGVDYTLNLTNDALSVTVGTAVLAPAKSDIDGNGISDVMFVWTGNNYLHGYWMNGTSTWQSANSNHPAEWDNLGCYDMTGDGKADSVLVGNVVVNEVKGAYIGYYADAIDNPDGSTWVNIGYLTNEDDIQWKNVVGNLTGGEANSIVWYAPELYALGVWTDGTDAWGTLSNSFGGNDWTLVGCGDFDGDGKDSVLMNYGNGSALWIVGLNEDPISLGNDLNWHNWKVSAIGDFSGDGKDDIVMFHEGIGAFAMIKDGNANIYYHYGSLSNDWKIVGCGDYDGDSKDDLLIQQISTGILGYYSEGVQDTDHWHGMGNGVGSSWTVIA